eukprot:Gregarina_sp_Poly_1__4567@NODE_244_length_10763_cov_79_258975_g214_i0_p3_GENE_NODE_244_length_10763_cov_79_258975_g214_i0NODE_244_length_10763_cov_79_258975_g214_i0_p3_ORF_typecomplete_len493_score42_42_NODE_244_length_10763_cov_79_258975_g214_i044285906
MDIDATIDSAILGILNYTTQISQGTSLTDTSRCCESSSGVTSLPVPSRQLYGASDCKHCIASSEGLFPSMLSDICNIDDGQRPLIPCTPPPSLVLLLLLNGSLGLAALRRSSILRDVAASKLSDALVATADSMSPQVRRNLSVVARTLQKAYSYREDASLLSLAAAPLVSGQIRLQTPKPQEQSGVLPDIASQLTGFRVPHPCVSDADVSHVQPQAINIKKRHADPGSSVRRSQSLSVTQLAFHASKEVWAEESEGPQSRYRKRPEQLCPLQLFHPLASVNLKNDKLGCDVKDRQTKLLQKLSALSKPDSLSKTHEVFTGSETLEHLHSRTDNREVRYGCRIVPIYEDKQTRYRALRAREENRWREDRKHDGPLSIQQLAIASLSRHSPKEAQDELPGHPTRLSRAPHAGRRASGAPEPIHAEPLVCFSRQSRSTGAPKMLSLAGSMQGPYLSNGKLESGLGDCALYSGGDMGLPGTQLGLWRHFDSQYKLS